MTPPEVRDATRTQLSMLLRGIICQRLPAKIGGGRVAAQEIMVVNETIRQLIAENKLYGLEDAIEDGAYYGMQTFNQAFVNLINQRLITPETALQNTENPTELELLFKGIRKGSSFDGFGDGTQADLKTDITVDTGDGEGGGEEGRGW
ncbi:MAG: hypothetical protein LIQ31_08720 [Planctomycetes bacterium]|nr:hypothetical protein [Planctomycetota bacterium]